MVFLLQNLLKSLYAWKRWDICFPFLFFNIWSSILQHLIWCIKKGALEIPQPWSLIFSLNLYKTYWCWSLCWKHLFSAQIMDQIFIQEIPPLGHPTSRHGTWEYLVAIASNESFNHNLLNSARQSCSLTPGWDLFFLNTHMGRSFYLCLLSLDVCLLWQTRMIGKPCCNGCTCSQSQEFPSN